MRMRSVGLAAAAIWAIACNAVLGDFSVGAPDATTMNDAGGEPDASVDGSPRPDATPDGTLADAANDTGSDGKPPAHDSGADSGCASGLTACASGCIALDAAANCGACGHDCTALVSGGHVIAASVGCGAAMCTYTCVPGYGDCADSGAGCATNLEDASASCGVCGRDCHGGGCSAGTCGVYVVAAQPTTGAVAKLATDGTRVIWSDTGLASIEQVAATGGTPIVLVGPGSNGGASSELALAGTTVAFTYASGTAPSVGLAKVDVPNSGVSVFNGAVAVGAVSLSSDARHVFYVDTTGTRSSLNDCLINGLTGGTCYGVGGGGRYTGQTAADATYMFFDLTGADVMQAGLYLDVINAVAGGDAGDQVDIFTTDTAASLAVDGTWAYWTVQNDGGASYTLQRTLEAMPGTNLQTPAANLASSAFATDGSNVYYWNGSAIVAKPAAGGPVKTLAPATAFPQFQIAVGGGLLVWTDGATIWGLVL